jgi:flagellar hook-associated protein 3 FlgL
MPDLLAALAESQRQEDNALLQLASGRRINQPSDDPGGAALLSQIRDRGNQADSFLRSAGNVSGQLQMADSALSSVVEALQRAISLGTEGGTGTINDADRASIADEVVGLRDQLVSLANVSYQGRYVFAGTAETQPFVKDSNVPSGVRYAGDRGVNAVEIGNGFQIAVNQPGSDIFNAPGSDVFEAIQDLITGLQTNSGIDSAVVAVRKAYDYVAQKRVFYGNSIQQIGGQQNYLKNEKLQLGQQEDTVAAADMAAVASQLVNAANARNATLAAVAKTSQLSLFDYLA